MKSEMAREVAVAMKRHSETDKLSGGVYSISTSLHLMHDT